MNAPFDNTGLTLQTPRLLLRPWREEDASDFYEYARVDGVGQMAGWLPHQSIEESRMVLHHFMEEKRCFAVVYRENGKVIGSLDVKKYGAEEKLTEFDGLLGAELGFVLSADYWGRGLMPEAAGALIRFLFTEKSFDFLLCGHFDSNSRSCRVQQKLGFRPYRRLTFDTRLGTRRSGVLNLLLNPAKRYDLHFSHPETLIYE